MRSIAIAAAALCATAGTASAGGLPVCEDLDLPNPVYVQSGDTQEPLLKTLGAALASAASDNISFIYWTTGSCTNIDAIRNDTVLAVGKTMRYVPAGFDPSTASPECTLGEAHPLDISVSALFNSACTQEPAPAAVIEREGPIQAYVFAVPEASTQVAITAEEAYFVFGFGAIGMAMPWIDELQLFIRPVTKSTLLAMAAAIQVPAASWKGQPLERSTEVVAALQGSTSPEAAIGILGAEIYDRNRATLDALAFQAYGQWFAYYPDSTATAEDKQNVRDGHYFPWSPTVWMTRDTSPNHARANDVVDLILGVDQRSDFDPLEIEIGLGLIPKCAMFVSREFEGGPLSLYDSPEPCACFYDSIKGETPSCEVCSDEAPCATGTCRHGFCEAR